jgi:hypothetical protein
MPDGWKEIVLALITAATGGTALWFKSWREDRKEKAATAATQKKEEEERRQAEMDRLRSEKRAAEERAEKYQARFESVLMDLRAKAEEDHVQRADRIATDKQWAALVTAMTAALDRADATIARLLKDGK